MNTRDAHPEHFFAAVEHAIALLAAGTSPSLISVMSRGAARRGLTDAAVGYDHARLMMTALREPKSCLWGRCNGTIGADGRCNRCGSKRP